MFFIEYTITPPIDIGQQLRGAFVGDRFVWIAAVYALYSVEHIGLFGNRSCPLDLRQLQENKLSGHVLPLLHLDVIFIPSGLRQLIAGLHAQKRIRFDTIGFFEPDRHVC